MGLLKFFNYLPHCHRQSLVWWFGGLVLVGLKPFTKIRKKMYILQLCKIVFIFGRRGEGLVGCLIFATVGNIEHVSMPEREGGMFFISMILKGKKV